LLDQVVLLGLVHVRNPTALNVLSVEEGFQVIGQSGEWAENLDSHQSILAGVGFIEGFIHVRNSHHSWSTGSDHDYTDPFDQIRSWVEKKPQVDGGIVHKIDKDSWIARGR